jgi:chromosome segregation ATPase
MPDEVLPDGTADPEGGQSTEDESGKQSTEQEASDDKGTDSDQKSPGYAELMARFEQLEGENRALRGTVQEALSRSEKEPDPEPSPELERNTRRTEALESDLKDLDADRSATLSAIGDARGKIQFIQGQIERADDLDKPELKAALAEAQRNEAKAKKEWRTFGRTERELKDKLSERKDERKALEAARKDERASQQQAEEDMRKFQESFPAYVSGLIVEAANEFKIPETEKLRNNLVKTVNNSVEQELRHMREQGVENVDMGALVKDHVKEYAEVHGLADREAFHKESADKRAVQRKPAGRRAAPTQTDDEPPKPRWQDVEERTPAMEKARRGIEKRFEELGGL